MNVTFGVTTASKTLDSLLLTVASVLTAETLPKGILLRFEGELPNFGSFYLEQLACYAQTLGVEWDMTVDKSRGIRYARDWLLDHCLTSHMWMGDDDVIYDYDCLRYLTYLPANTYPIGEMTGLLLGAIAGTKVDATNRRGYPDYSTEELDFFDPSIGPCCLNHYYKPEIVGCRALDPKFAYLDTGNCLLDVVRIKDAGVKFQLFPDSVPDSGGEDTLFAAALVKAGLCIAVATNARSCHLEKPKTFFNDISARREMIQRSRELLKL